MNLDAFTGLVRPVIELEMQRVVSANLPPAVPVLYEMMAYHLGWEGRGAGIEAQGKRVRPLLVLLAADAVGGDWHKALPAAVAVELLHNFSLIHDDIQDQSWLRRGRETVWVKWGVAQAINAGDVMFTLAHQALAELHASLPEKDVLAALRSLDETCIQLTTGQYLDLSYETRTEISLTDYWPMITGKTSALLGCCAELGGLAGGANDAQRKGLQSFGVTLGLAFQVLDDYLGVWGDASQTGKSIASDLISRKKTLPVLYGLAQEGAFAQRWRDPLPVTEDEISRLAGWLVDAGAQTYTLQEADRLTAAALAALDQVGDLNATASLRALAGSLLKRNN